MSHAEAQRAPSLQEETGMNEGFLKRKGEYNPDVLSCLANLSNDEVFTPPEIANRMLDLLPQKLFRDPKTTFLDPACKTGVFLREIAKRLMDGLAEAIPNENRRREHIFKKQLFGIAITELTALMSRRSVYCSKDASCHYSVVKFAKPDGNIRFKPTRHKWEEGRCVFCGASQKANDRDAALETHAYEFIHAVKPEEIFNMHFDVIIGNPPYQMKDGGGNGSSSAPIYQKFIQQAQCLRPRFLCMIIPARWYAGGKGLDEFRDKMIHDHSMRELHDFFDATLCFPGVDISGGVCYFLWGRDYHGECTIVTHDGTSATVDKRFLCEEGCDVFIRHKISVGVVRKVRSVNHGETFDTLVSSRRPYGLDTGYRGKKQASKNSVKLHSSGGDSYIGRDEMLDSCGQLSSWKLYMSVVYGERGDFPYLVLGKPVIGEPNSCCTDSYLSIGPFKTKRIAENAASYLRTRFFRFLVLIQKNTQIAPKKVYSFVPMQDFSKPWTDEELYRKYKLTAEEIAFIESMIRPMEV